MNNLNVLQDFQFFCNESEYKLSKYETVNLLFILRRETVLTGAANSSWTGQRHGGLDCTGTLGVPDLRPNIRKTVLCRGKRK